MILKLDNSALSTLHCKRRYQLTCIQGIDPGGSKDTDLGSAGHTLLEHLDKGEDIDKALEIMVATHGSKDQSKVLMAASMYRGATRLPPAVIIKGTPAIEYKFSFEYGTFIRSEVSERITVLLQGTIDRIYIDNKLDQLVIHDYKWSGAYKEDHQNNIMEGYDLAFQLPFYAFCLLNMPDFPEEYKEYIRSGNYRVELHFIFFNTDPPRTRKKARMAFRESFLLGEVPLLINTKIQEAINVAVLKDSAVHDGMLVYGACKGCPFKIACLEMGSEKEIDYLSRFPRREYDPMSFR
jgi:hypothetical protein